MHQSWTFSTAHANKVHHQNYSIMCCVVSYDICYCNLYWSLYFHRLLFKYIYHTLIDIWYCNIYSYHPYCNLSTAKHSWSI